MQAGYAKNKSSAAIIQACRCDWSVDMTSNTLLIGMQSQNHRIARVLRTMKSLVSKMRSDLLDQQIPKSFLKKSNSERSQVFKETFRSLQPMQHRWYTVAFDDHRAILFLVSWLVSVLSLSFVLRKTRGCLWRETVFLRASNGLHSFTAGIIVWFAVLARTVSRYAIAFASRPEHICVFASIRIASAKRYHRASLRP